MHFPQLFIKTVNT